MPLACARPPSVHLPTRTAVRTLTTMPRAVCSLVWLVAAALAAGDAPPTVRPLAMSGVGLEAVDHALIRLSRGDTSAVEALPIEAFLDPVARPDPHQAGLARRWTMALPAALARLDPAARTQALTRLDARYHTLAGTRSGNERARLASAFLPAPDAMLDLTRAGNRAFDLGRFADYLGMAYLLAAGGRNDDDARRQEVALQLSGLGPQVDASLHLPPPGTPVPSAANGVVPHGHLAMRWLVVPGWVLACDPFGGVVWQYRVDRLAQVTTGPGAVMVRDSSGLRALAEDGTVTVLPPLPSGATVLTIAGGAAWFATGDRAWRLGLADKEIQALDLAAPPLGAPIVRGPQSLWLTARELLLFDGDRLLHRFQHRLPAGSGWYLAVDGERPVVMTDDQRSWRLESIADQLARLDGVARAELLVRAGRFAEALHTIGEPRTDAERGVVLRAHLAQGPAHVVAQDAALDWCVTTQDRALIQLARLAASDPQGRALHVAQSPATTLKETLTTLDALSARDPTLLLTDQGRDLGDHPAHWDHACSGLAWQEWRSTHTAPAVPTPGKDGPLVEPHAVETPAALRLPDEKAVRQGDGALLVGDRTYRLERSIDAMLVTCQGVDGILRWRHRWRPQSFISAPSQSIDVRDGVVLVVEGGLRLNLFDTALGHRRGTFVVDELGSATPFLLADHLALIGPLGIDNHLTLVDHRGGVRTSTLPSPTRWSLPLGQRLLLMGQDGVARLMPGGRVVPLPDDLTRSRIAPRAHSEGLVLGEQLWRWKR